MGSASLTRWRVTSKGLAAGLGAEPSSKTCLEAAQARQKPKPFPALVSLMLPLIEAE